MISYKDTVPFQWPITSGYVVKVYDGDTITIASKMPYTFESPLYRFSVRLSGIDTPEMKSSNPTLKQAAHLAQSELETLIMNKTISLCNLQTEKYGRILADVFLENLHVNQWMIEKRLALAYDGKKKATDEEMITFLQSKA